MSYRIIVVIYILSIIPTLEVAKLEGVDICQVCDAADSISVTFHIPDSWCKGCDANIASFIEHIIRVCPTAKIYICIHAERNAVYVSRQREFVKYKDVKLRRHQVGENERAGDIVFIVAENSIVDKFYNVTMARINEILNVYK
jgi:hypothetical protein